MRTLPRHLLLAAVVLTVCCAERQAVAATLDLQKVASEVAGQRIDQARRVEQSARMRRARQQHVRPASIDWRERLDAAFAPTEVLANQARVAVVHAIYPPSRFRLPPPFRLA